MFFSFLHFRFRFFITVSSLIGKMAAECDQQDVFPGQYFDSFEDLKSLLCRRHEKTNEKLVIGKSSISVKAANSKLKKDFRFKEELVYTHVIYRCVHEGKFSSKGSSKQSTSLKNGCPVTIKLRADKNLNKLQVVSANLQHNHVIPAKK
ncbi:hypothetical protein EGW08_023808, partial [Elysia chlorotica]